MMNVISARNMTQSNGSNRRYPVPKRPRTTKWVPTPQGDRLRAARIKAGYRTAEEAVEALRRAKIDINLSTYYQHESGRRPLTAESVQKFATHYGVTVEHLLYGRQQTIRVAVQGTIGADGIVTLHADEDVEDTIELPAFVGDSLVFIRAKGRDLPPGYNDGDLVGYDKEIFSAAIDPSAIRGRDCIVKDGSGTISVATVVSCRKTGAAIIRRPSGNHQVILVQAAPIAWVKKA
jgi:hypothetical protein